MSVDAVLFDLDGTLVDSLEDIARALDLALDDHGLTRPPRGSIKAWVGGGARQLVAHAVAAPLVDGVLARFRIHYAAAPVVATTVYPGIATLLDALVAAGKQFAILSNKPDELTRAIATHLLAGWPFAVVAGHVPGGPLKPDPGGALAIATALGVSPDRCAYVGDADTDVATARAAGMRALAVTWGYRGRRVLEAAGPDAIVDAPAELARLLVGP